MNSMTTHTAVVIETNSDVDARVARAVETFLRREERSESPAGEWQEGVWRPAPEEQKACCRAIAPTSGNKQALEAHCRTILHVAALFHVPATDLKRAVRAARGQARLGLKRTDPEERKSQAERFFEASITTREEAYAALQSEAARFAVVQQSLLSIGKEEPHALAALLESAGVGLERCVLALEYATQVETAYRFAASALEKYRSIERFGLDDET